jgi:ABC-type cobalt transport system substrate-binding protein
VPDREVLFGAGLGAWNGADTATTIDSDKLVAEVSPFSSAVTEPPSPDVEPGLYALLQFPTISPAAKDIARLGR